MTAVAGTMTLGSSARIRSSAALQPLMDDFSPASGTGQIADLRDDDLLHRKMDDEIGLAVSAPTDRMSITRAPRRRVGDRSRNRRRDDRHVHLFEVSSATRGR
jgi:hypothetical protein